jgi:hypothetical protein
MSSIAEELDRVLKTVHPEKAAHIVRSVREMLKAVEPEWKANLAHTANGYPEGFWEEIRQLWGDEPFERPDQGVEEIREDW